MVRKPSASTGDVRDVGLVSGLGRTAGGGHWQPTPVFLPGESQGQRSLVGCSPQGCKESDMSEFHYINYINTEIHTHPLLAWHEPNNQFGAFK